MSTMPACPTTMPDAQSTVREVSVEYRGWHRKPMSPLSVRLSDDLHRMWVRSGALKPTVARHRLDVGAES
jgi:hypothetical protein